MDLKSLIAKMDALSEAEVDPQRAAYDKFKADDARAAAQEQVKKLASIPLDQIGRLQNVIDPKTGIIYYGEAGLDSFKGNAKPYSFDWYTKGQEKEFFNILKTAGLTVVDNGKGYAKVDPDQLATLGAEATTDAGTKVDNSAEMAKIKQLEELVDKYLALKQTTVKEDEFSIAGSLMESFGYQLDEADPSMATQAWDAVKSGGTAVKNTAIAAGKKLAVPVGVAVAVWELWDRLTKLPPNMTPEQTKMEVSKSIGKLIATYGTFWVGSIIGGIMAGAITGPFAVPAAVAGALAGGFGASWLLDEKAEAIVDKVVEYLMKNKTATAAAPAAAPGNAPAAQAGMPVGGDPEIVKFQQMLKGEGYDLGTFGPNKDGIDGQLGSKTITAIQQDLIKNGAKITVSGQLDQPTLGAMIKVYGIKV